MVVDDHGLEVLKKAGLDLKPNTAPKSDYALQFRATPDTFQFIRAASTAVNSTSWTPVNFPVFTGRTVFAHDSNKTIWITSDNTISGAGDDGTFPLFSETSQAIFLKPTAIIFARVITGTGTLYVGAESNV